ncbi:unnamed protein product [Dimorphilus gyrociliatus]|uniref:Uncharacterized protein n=1 Tax=Dimorphilus gyrociliatus TaxID=2664684 RepID=A0A7I8WCQ4_9ANNE|nr:unnamed protein product [Dimorphilus gyrociliatus]
MKIRYYYKKVLNPLTSQSRADTSAEQRFSGLPGVPVAVAERVSLDSSNGSGPTSGVPSDNPHPGGSPAQRRPTARGTMPPTTQMTMGGAVQSNDGSTLSELMDKSPVRRDGEKEDAAKQDAGSLASVPAEDNGLDSGLAEGAAEDEDAGYMANMLCAADVRLASQERLLCLPAARRSFPPRTLFIPPADPVCVCVCVPVSDNLSNSPISVPVTSTPVSRPDKVDTMDREFREGTFNAPSTAEYYSLTCSQHCLH